MKTCILLAVCLCCLSCKKVYTCECYTTVRYYSSNDKRFYTDIVPGSKTEYEPKFQRKKAEAACKHEQQAIESSFLNWYTGAGLSPLKDGESISTSCALK